MSDYMPIRDELFVEAMERLEEYTSHPKRQAEQNYVIRFATILWRYKIYVQTCIERGEMPPTWESYIELPPAAERSE